MDHGEDGHDVKRHNRQCHYNEDHQQSKPQLKELVRYTERVVTCWKQLALELSLSAEVVNTIDVDHGSVNNKCYDMFNTWLRQTCDPCWCQVANAFKMVKLNEAAREIESKFVSIQEPLQPPALQINATSQMASEHKILLNEPKMHDLNRFVIPEIEAHWEEVAYALDFEISAVKSIHIKHNGDPKKCCQELLKSWLTTSQGVSPKILLTLLQRINEVSELATVRARVLENLPK